MATVDYFGGMGVDMNTEWPTDSFQEFFQSIALDPHNTIEGDVLQTVDKIVKSLFEVSTKVREEGSSDCSSDCC